MENYAGAKQDFAIRSGLIQKEQLFTPEPVSYTHLDARRGDKRLAGADIALYKAAHRHAGDHVLHGGGDGAPRCV